MNRYKLAHFVVVVVLSFAVVGVVGCRLREQSSSEVAVSHGTPPPRPSVEQSASITAEESETKMQIGSDVFEHGQPLPDKYAHKHENLSPPLKWSGVPEGAVELALVCDDPDAPVGTFTHWLIWGLSPQRTELPEGGAKTETVANLENAVQGTNDFGEIGYDGPQPPSGTHRYFFRLYALGEKLELAPGAGVKQVRAALEGKVLAKAETMATYSR